MMIIKKIRIISTLYFPSFVLLLLIVGLSACVNGGSSGIGGSSCGVGAFSVGNVTLDVDVACIEFSAQQSGDLPEPQNVSVSFTGIGPGVVVGLAPGYAEAQNWLSAQLIGSASDRPLSFQVFVTSSDMPVGEYSAVLRFLTGTGDTNYAYDDILVTYKVTEPLPSMKLSQSRFNFSGYYTTDISTQTLLFSIENVSSDYTWSAKSSDPWLLLNGANSIEGTNAGQLEIGINSNALNVGSYNGTINIVANVNGEVIEASIGVTATLSLPSLSVSNATMSFSGINGKNIAAKSLSVSLPSEFQNTVWQAASNQAWLSINGTDSLQINGNSDLEISVNSGGLSSAQQYQGTVLLTAQIGIETIETSVIVSLELTPAQITTDHTAVTFSGINGGDKVGSMLSFMLDTDLPSYSWKISSNADWLLVNGSPLALSDVLSGNGNATIALSFDDSTFKSNTEYTANLTISAQINGDEIVKVVPITGLFQTPTLSLSSENIMFRGRNASDLQNQILQFSLNTGQRQHPWEASITSNNSVNWVSSDNSIGMLSNMPVELLLQEHLDSLLSGLFSATLSLKVFVNGDVLFKSIPISMTLEPNQLFVVDNGLAFVDFANLPNQTDVLSRSTTVSDLSGKGVAFTAASNQPWLQVATNASTNTANNLDMQIDTTLANPPLVPGNTYFAEVSLFSNDVSIENSGGEKIRVGFYLSDISGLPQLQSVAEATLSILDLGIASDPIRPLVYTASGGTGIEIYNIYTATQLTPNPLANIAANIRQVAVSSDGSRLFAVDYLNGSIVVVDLDSLSVIGTWNNIRWPTSSILSIVYQYELKYARPDGYPVVITGNGEMLDAASGDTLSTIAVRLDRPATIDVSGNSKVLYTQEPYNVPGKLMIRHAIEYSQVTHQGTVTPVASLNNERTLYQIAVDFNGSNVLTAPSGTPNIGFQRFSFNPLDNTLSELNSLPAPESVRSIVYTPDYQRIIGGTPTTNDTQDLELFIDENDTNPQLISLPGFVRQGQLTVSGDGLRIISRSYSPEYIHFLNMP